MVQTTYQIDTDIGQEGLLADTGNQNVMSYKAQNAVPFGRAVVVGVDGKTGFLPASNVSTIVYDADFVASNEIEVTVLGETVTVDFDTDQDTTMTALVDAVDALDDISAEATDTGGNNRTIAITSEIKPVGTVTTTITGGASQAGSTITYSLDAEFGGISFITHTNEQTLTGKDSYEDGKAVNTLSRGRVYVKAETAMALGDNVFFRYEASGNNDELGKFRNDADSSTAVQITAARVVQPAAADELSVIEVNLP